MNLEKNLTIHFSGRLELKDFVRYNAFHVKNRFITILVLLSIAFSMVYWLLKGHTLPLFSIIFLGIFSGVFLWGIMVLVLYLNVKAAFSSDAIAQLNQNYQAGEKGITVNSERFNSQYIWSDFVGVYEYKDLFILYISTIKAIVLPNRYFSTQHDIIDFKLLLNKHITCKNNIVTSITDVPVSINKP